MDKNHNQRRALGERIFKRHRNLWVYMFFGFVAALINTVVFMFMHDVLHTVLVIDNTVAFIVSNLASFWFNHKAVFTKNVDHEHSLWQKLLSFFAYRIISLLPDTLIMWLGMSIFGWPALIVKIIDQILVGIFNYLTTKSVFEQQERSFRRKLQNKLKKR
ncbi:cellwall teichoic acid glycosylation protein [Lactobacillus nasalidis]|uniref:Cellwall teichoic acid glycosylation protein n=1 Tax=Lactobacillus nasalidis TaxID=2797258 RepID=A0ABQ3W8R7_9LACO|nr:GtrA family protein [Lactobacillus nasalidis]GHV97630.1 cellwall teichoic acid glycosylation protein [Lactobacillus nasalidis]GHV99501.1 cellwall teichoic acid glycosylation protein [Lactobacillus nasalidis]GHW01262.1 cellwall teichoic acid glycosylation protein [Lactobacillus nasalidis]